MTPRPVTETYHVTPQIEPRDIPAIVAAGYKTVICNRPDDENPPALHASEVRAQAEGAGLTFLELPFNQMTLNIDLVGQQRAFIETAEGPILAYCASGNRCTVIWGLGEAQSGQMSRDEILESGAAAGYDLRGLAGTLDSLIAQRT